MDGAAKVKVAEGAGSSTSSFPSSSPPKIAPSLLEGNDGVSDAESANAEDGAGYGGPGSGEWGPELQFRSSLVRIRAPVTEIDEAEGGEEEEEEEEEDDASGASYDTALERMAAASTLSSLYGSPRGTPTGSVFGSEAGERDSLHRRLREVMPAGEAGRADPTEEEEYGKGNGGEGQLMPVAKLTADDEPLEYGEQSGLVSGASGYLYSDEEEEYGEEVTSGLRTSAAGLHIAGAAQLATPDKGAVVEDSPEDADFTAPGLARELQEARDGDGERPLPPAAHGSGPADGSVSESAAPAPLVLAAEVDDSQELPSHSLPQGYPVAVGQEEAEPQGLGQGLGDGLPVAGELEAASEEVPPVAGGEEAVSGAGSSGGEGQGAEQASAQLESQVLEPEDAGVTTQDVGVTTQDAHSSTASPGPGAHVPEVRAPEPPAAEGAPLAEASQQATAVVASSPEGSRESEPVVPEGLPIARASEDDDDSSGYTSVAAVTYDSREPEPATAEGLPIARGLDDDVSDSRTADVSKLELATATVEEDGPSSRETSGQVHEPATAEGLPVAGASSPDPEAAEGLPIARVTEDEAGAPTFPSPLGDVSRKDQEALAPPEAATAAGVVPIARLSSEDAGSLTHTSVADDVPSERGLRVARVTDEADVAPVSPLPGYVSPESATATGLPVAGVTQDTDVRNDVPPESTARGLPIARLTEEADIPSSTSVTEDVPIAKVTDTPTSSSDGAPESDVTQGKPTGDANATAVTDTFPETAPLPLESAVLKEVDSTDGELDQAEAPKTSKDNGVIPDQAPLQEAKALSESGDPGAQEDELEKQQPETVTTPSDTKDIDSNSVVKSVLEYAAAAKLEDSVQKHVSDKELQQDTVTIVQVGGSKHRNLAQLLHSEAEAAVEEAPAGSETEPAAKQPKPPKVKIFQVAKEFGKTARSKGARFAKTTLKVLHFRNVNCFSPRKPQPVVGKEDDLEKPRTSVAK